MEFPTRASWEQYKAKRGLSEISKSEISLADPTALTKKERNEMLRKSIEKAKAHLQRTGQGPGCDPRKPFIPPPDDEPAAAAPVRPAGTRVRDPIVPPPIVGDYGPFEATEKSRFRDDTHVPSGDELDKALVDGIDWIM